MDEPWKDGGDTTSTGDVSTPSGPATPSAEAGGESMEDPGNMDDGSGGVASPPSGPATADAQNEPGNGTTEAPPCEIRETLACRKPSAPNVTSPEPAQSSVSPLPSSGMLEVKQEQPDSSVEPAVPRPDPADAWRCDKHGKPCTPEALYMRFYRRLRSYSSQSILFDSSYVSIDSAI